VTTSTSCERGLLMDKSLASAFRGFTISCKLSNKQHHRLVNHRLPTHQKPDNEQTFYAYNCAKSPWCNFKFWGLPCKKIILPFIFPSFVLPLFLPPLLFFFTFPSVPFFFPLICSLPLQIGPINTGGVLWAPPAGSGVELRQKTYFRTL